MASGATSCAWLARHVGVYVALSPEDLHVRVNVVGCAFQCGRLRQTYATSNARNTVSLCNAASSRHRERPIRPCSAMHAGHEPQGCSERHLVVIHAPPGVLPHELLVPLLHAVHAARGFQRALWRRRVLELSHAALQHFVNGVCSFARARSVAARGSTAVRAQ